MRCSRLWQQPGAALPFLPPAVRVRRAQSACVFQAASVTRLMWAAPRFSAVLASSPGSSWWPYSTTWWTLHTVLHAARGRTGDVKVAALFVTPSVVGGRGNVDGF